MLAAAIGIDRAIEADVGGIVARDHLACGVERHRRLERRQVLKAPPAIVEADPHLGLKAAACVGLRAASAPPLLLDGCTRLSKWARRTRRQRRRRWRRMLEGMRGGATHGDERSSASRTNQEQKIRQSWPSKPALA